MGANQSSDGGNGGTRGGGPGTGQVKTCYYELLGIDPKASEEELGYQISIICQDLGSRMHRIKKAYRKKALELHPDRNYGDAEAATKQFADVQSAYEVLSDPQERAWYDTHRETILRDDDDGDHFEHNLRVTTAEDILRLFSKFNSQIDFSDSPTGFYGALGILFDTLAQEEEVACEWEGLDSIQYPSFGHKSDEYESVVRPFYAMWSCFVTKKTFSWKDIYRYSEAPDRKIRRLMEKENKRFRDEGIREFNDAVRSLVAFVRKRDPRFKPNKRSEADRQRVLKDAATAQAARSRAANQARVAEEAIPEWMRSTAPEDGDSFGEVDESKAAKEEVECVICNKTFKSENQYEAHERSKKHSKAVQQIRRRMRQEDSFLDLQEASKTQVASNEADGDPERPSKDSKPEVFKHLDEPGDHDGARVELTLALGDSSEELLKMPGKHHDQVIDSEGNNASDEDYAPRAQVEQRLSDQHEVARDERSTKGKYKKDLAERVAEESMNDEKETMMQPKVGKAKKKRAKKAAQNTFTSSIGSYKCAHCQADFPSNTQLFNHIKHLGHAQSTSKQVNGGKGKRG